LRRESGTIDGREYRLVEPHERYRDAFLRLSADYRQAGEERLEEVSDFPAYVRRMQDAARGIGLSPGWVPYTTFWTLASDITPPSLIGIVNLRHRLTPALKKEGGHIGYTIAPSFRGRGLGTLQLALALDEIRRRYDEFRLDRVLITCDTDNIASARIIWKNGGVFESEVISDFSGKPVSRYWVDLTRKLG
jgi:predicted acetyltransferase